MSVNKTPRIPLPKSWNTHLRSAVLHVISLAQFAAAYTRGWAANSINARMRLRTDRDRLNQELAQLREELRIKDAPSGTVTRATSSCHWPGFLISAGIVSLGSDVQPDLP